jgi:hypothetical protein
MSELRASYRSFPPRDNGPRLRGRALRIECAGLGGAIGGTAGVVAAAVSAMDSVAIAVLNIVIAGPLAAALLGAALGALAGVSIGAWLDAHVASREPTRSVRAREGGPTGRRLRRDMAA